MTMSLVRIYLQVLEKDAVFVPAGYDSKEKISVSTAPACTLTRNCVQVLEDSSKEGAYEDVICRPDEVKKAVRQLEEVVAKDDDAFLEEHQVPSSNTHDCTHSLILQGRLAEAATSDRRPNRALSFQGDASSKLETPTLPTSVPPSSHGMPPYVTPHCSFRPEATPLVLWSRHQALRP